MDGSGILMAVMCAAMGIVGIVNTSSAWKREKAEYEEGLKNWREHYQTYINNLMASIRMRQKKDVAKMDSLYPDMLTLINPDQKGIYGMNGNIYSRAPQDEDFLTFRMGVSDDVPSHFEVKGEGKDTVYSETFFDIIQESGNDRLRVYLRQELKKHGDDKENLCNLPGAISKRFACLPGAPLLYSLKNKGCLGIVDRQAGEVTSRSYYFISRMIFELCYYHTPEDLQFVVFFPPVRNWDKIEDLVNRYKFMPHFRGLFSDKAQFVFNKEDAHIVMSNLLSVMGERREKGPGA
jgi:S-DNA-T family DNA segregation ATPase FtsK/SpoIIIE